MEVNFHSNKKNEKVKSPLRIFIISFISWEMKFLLEESSFFSHLPKLWRLSLKSLKKTIRKNGTNWMPKDKFSHKRKWKNTVNSNEKRKTTKMTKVKAMIKVFQASRKDNRMINFSKPPMPQTNRNRIQFKSNYKNTKISFTKKIQKTRKMKEIKEMQKTKETKRFFSVTVTETSVKVLISETMNAEQLLWSESLESTTKTLLWKENNNIFRK